MRLIKSSSCNTISKLLAVARGDNCQGLFLYFVCREVYTVMAEFVQSRLEESLPELDVLEKLNLFDASEIKQIIRKIKTFEYRLQRIQKSKEDYLKFIEYLCSYLDLIQIRRKKKSRWYHKEDVERVIEKKIKRLYKAVINSNKADLKLWQGYITVCRERRWFSGIEKLYIEMLKCHTDKPEIWIAAAKWDFEENASIESARKTLLRGIRFNPNSHILYRELLELELNQAEIEMTKAAEEIISNENYNKETCIVANTAVAQAVYKNAVAVIDDVEFAVSLLQVCDKHTFLTELQEAICANLHAKYSESEFWRNTWALRPLKLSASADNAEMKCENAETECIKRFEEAVNQLSSEKMWTYYLEFCLNKMKANPSQNNQHILDAFSKAAEGHFLSLNMLQEWASLALKHNDKLGYKVLRYAVKKYPSVASFWEYKIRYSIRNGTPPKKLEKIIKKALSSVQPSDLLPLWKMALSWYVINASDKVESFFDAALSLPPNVASEIKILHLKWIFSTQGYESAWNLYEKIWSIPPIDMGFFTTMQDIIEATPKPSITRLRKVMRSVQSNYGENNIDVWIESMILEKKYSSTEDTQVARIYRQAIKTLTGSLVDHFMAYYTLQNTNVLE
ncbi:U3 snoRNP protein [Chamberlinius hualienensis]